MIFREVLLHSDGNFAQMRHPAGLAAAYRVSGVYWYCSGDDYANQCERHQHFNQGKSEVDVLGTLISIFAVYHWTAATKITKPAGLLVINPPISSRY